MEPVMKANGKSENQGDSKDCPLEDCRNLVRFLARKTGILYRECRFEQEKAGHFRAMASILAAQTVLVNRLNRESGKTQAPDIFKDVRDFSNHTVRSCDLDRISDK